jgi:hypothetical protein
LNQFTNPAMGKPDNTTHVSHVATMSGNSS